VNIVVLFSLQMMLGIEDDGMRWRIAFSRMIAGLLAAGGAYWGLMFLPLIFHAEHPIFPLLLFGPGYAVTLAYVIRLFSTPPLRARQFIWVLSILVQGGWLVCYVVVSLADGASIRRLAEPILIVFWWLFAFVGSITALIMEKPGWTNNSSET
jgi:hypothetical protein